MSKITSLIKRAGLVSGVTGAVIIGATGTANASVPAGQAQVAASSAGVSHAAQNEDPITTRSYGDCRYVLEAYGYRVTNTRAGLCAAASFPFPGQATRISVCTAGMIATGVGVVIAPAACIAATA